MTINRPEPGPGPIYRAPTLQHVNQVSMTQIPIAQMPAAQSAAPVAAEPKQRRRLFGKKKKREEQPQIMEISLPTSFKHEGHIGWDMQRGFEVSRFYV